MWMEKYDFHIKATELPTSSSRVLSLAMASVQPDSASIETEDNVMAFRISIKLQQLDRLVSNC